MPVKAAKAFHTEDDKNTERTILLQFVNKKDKQENKRRQPSRRAKAPGSVSSNGNLSKLKRKKRRGDL